MEALTSLLVSAARDVREPTKRLGLSRIMSVWYWALPDRCKGQSRIRNFCVRGLVLLCANNGTESLL